MYCSYIVLFSEMFRLSKLILFFLFIHVICETESLVYRNYNLERYNKREHVKIVRNNRATKVIESPVFAGMKATQDFLRNAKLLVATSEHRLYEKSGGLKQALSDFKATKPTEIVEMKDGYFKEIGDRRIILLKAAWRGKPTVEIIQPTHGLGARGEMITVKYND